MTTVYPLVLCGGVGTRLWPLSRTMQPKQFQPIEEEGSPSFFQATIQRHRHGIFNDPLICASVGYLDTVRRQLRDLQCNARIMAEPIGRNTGPAVLAAALRMLREDRDAVLVVLPSDHVIKGDLNTTVAQMRQAANDGLIITFGIEPTYAESGYGYILDGGAYYNYQGLHKVAQFIEKPEVQRAADLIAAGGAYWASGISMFRADVLVEEYQRFDPITYSAVHQALEKGSTKGDETVLDEEHFADAVSDPTERAVFENSRIMGLAPCDVDWSDVGAWSAFHSVGDKSEEGNVVSGDVVMIESRDSYVRGGDRLIAVVGMKDVVVVDTEDALLVTNRQSSQKVKKVVEELSRRERREVEDHASVTTDWGQLTLLTEGTGFALNLLTIRPHTCLPIAGDRQQRLLTVADGVLHFEAGGRSEHLVAGQSAEMTAGETASLFNDQDVALQVIEVCCDAETPVEAMRPLVELATNSSGKDAYV